MLASNRSPCLAGVHVASFLILTCLGQQHWHHVGIRSVSAFAAKSRPTKKAMPEAELIKRRKSPALWRYDLSNIDDDESASGSVVPDGGHPKKTVGDGAKWYPDTPPEIMSPAGGLPQLRAAIANGADSVYLGCSAFSARARAANFDPVAELPDAVRLAHASGVKVYVALNTLVFNKEMEEVAGLIQQIDKAGVDALIVQDLGICKVAKMVAPRLELHASTQQSVTSADGVRHAASLGANRVVLGRELSVKEIESVSEDMRGDSSVETEVFVHGALCVS